MPRLIVDGVALKRYVKGDSKIRALFQSLKNTRTFVAYGESIAKYVLQIEPNELSRFNVNWVNYQTRSILAFTYKLDCVPINAVPMPVS